ncbi:hypothetical protein ACIA8O_39840 [Kitasatospora sp. NPDC051853]|uniref:hypothetical protein n=1 Tax=Kitasatospora sp. NPDC051853 TaxID=3364058 RepID=UPI0037915487
MTTDTILDLPEMPPIETAVPAAEPPKRGRGRPRKNPEDKAPTQRTSAARKPTAASLEKRLGASMTTVGTLVAIASPADGMVMLEGIPALASALTKLAEENPAVRSNLERALTAGAWSGVVAATLPIVLGIMANHGAVPKNIAAMLGVPGSSESPGATA